MRPQSRLPKSSTARRTENPQLRALRALSQEGKRLEKKLHPGKSRAQNQKQRAPRI